MSFRSGFITVVGSPNVGKSTLINAMVGQKITIVSERAQTTRNRILGVVTRKDYQLVFIDTPGITNPRNKLGGYMLKIALDSLNEVEAVLFMIDATVGIGEKDELIIAKLRGVKAPVLAAINKIDSASVSDIESIEARLSEESFVEQVIRISAKYGDRVPALERAILRYIPEGPMYYPEDMVTDMPERGICAEFIREKALRLLREEIPHGIGVGVDKMELRDDIYDVWATIYCEREGHKGIIIGKHGAMLKQIGTEARHEMTWLLGTRVNLQLWVKVKPDWRNNISVMHELGYE
ncbi:MAG: GTPase Era [Clostridia bacterium]|nr:GTPase Era [Clostridia bacterium]